MDTHLTTTASGAVAAVDPLADFGAFLRLHTVEGDASAATMHFSWPWATTGAAAA